jgi:hypothetical protein
MEIKFLTILEIVQTLVSGGTVVSATGITLSLINDENSREIKLRRTSYSKEDNVYFTAMINNIAENEVDYVLSQDAHLLDASRKNAQLKVRELKQAKAAACSRVCDEFDPQIRDAQIYLAKFG